MCAKSLRSAKVEHYILDENDEPVLVGMMECARWCMNNPDKVHVAKTELADCELSTVFLRMDLGSGFMCENLRTAGPYVPTLFESMWFGGPLDGEQRRYHTKAEALIGHQEMLDEHSKLVNDPNMVVATGS
jgi:hypothetical protein